MTPDKYEDKEHLIELKKWFKINEEYTRAEALANLCNAWNFGNTKAGNFLSYYIKNDFIGKTKKDRSPKQRY